MNGPPPLLQSAICSTGFIFIHNRASPRDLFLPSDMHTHQPFLLFFRGSSKMSMKTHSQQYLKTSKLLFTLVTCSSSSICELLSHRFILVRHTHQSTHAARVIALLVCFTFFLKSPFQHHLCSGHGCPQNPLQQLLPPPFLFLQLTLSVCGVPKYSPLRYTGRRTGQWPLTFLGWFCFSNPPPALWRSSCL